MDDSIKAFLMDRKADRIKKKIGVNSTAEQVLAVEQEVNTVFLLDNWLPDAAKRANQLSLTSHPSKFSHPDSKTSQVIATNKRAEDGFLRTGNAHADLDVYGNAAAMDVYKFLSLVLNDGNTILAHLELQSERIKNELKVTTATFDEISTGLLSIKKNHVTAITSSRLKQVYYPVGDNYHLLSILTPSGLIFELRNRVQNIRFSQSFKKAREDKRKNIHNDIGFDDLFDLSIIGYGGTKPQNISVLNSLYGGKSYLLPSIPPALTKQKTRLPKTNFFINSLRLKHFKDDFIKIHGLLKVDYNNKNIRDGLLGWIQSILNDVIEQMWIIRTEKQGWSADKKYAQLPIHQKLWLDEFFKEERLMDEAWIQKVINDFARWFIFAYQKILGKQVILLDDAVLTYIKTIIDDRKEDWL